ncbi:MAG: sigma-70 family RNA polymerase sigma factor, partial [Planctomycetota bacterium]
MRSVLDEVQDPVYRFCLLQLGREEQALEAAQETALRIVKSYGRFEGKSKTTTWALGIARNVCRELWRQAERRPASIEPEEASQATSGDCQFERGEEIAQLKAAMHLLTERQRATLTLRFFEELSVSETAQALQMAEGTVKATTSQALKQLRRL